MDSPVIEAIRNAEAIASEFDDKNAMIVLNCLTASMRCGKDFGLAITCREYAVECLKFIEEIEKNMGCEGA